MCSCLVFPNVIKKGTDEVIVPIPAIMLVRSLEEADGYKVRIDLSNGQFIKVNYNSEKERDEVLGYIQGGINDFYNR